MVIKKTIQIINLFCQLFALVVPPLQYYIGYGTIFALAYMSKDFRCIVDINYFGEADFEILIWCLETPILFWGMVLNFLCISRCLEIEWKEDE